MLPCPPVLRNAMIRNYLSARRHLSSSSKINYVLGIESSCDDTAVAIVNDTGRVVHEVSAAQWEVHAPWKGIVPNLAARAHQENLPVVLERLISESPLESLRDVSAIAVTAGPGMAPCLNAGLTVAKSVATKYNRPLIAVNHLEAHVLSAFLTDDEKSTLEYPYLTLLISGGHCTLAIVHEWGSYEEIGGTLDDSVGEAFDKVARTLGLLDDEKNSTIHAGRALESLASTGNPSSFLFTEPMVHKKGFDFSFSGLKSQVRYCVKDLEKKEDLSQSVKANVAASFQVTATKHLVRRTNRAMESYAGVKHLVVCGGVAANTYVRTEIQCAAKKFGITAIFPPARYCTDNGAMVAYAGLQKARHGMFDNVSTVDFDARWALVNAHETPLGSAIQEQQHDD